jgi:hypothetical protein
MNTVLFEHCMENLATAIHAEMLAGRGLQQEHSTGETRVPQFLNTALHTLSVYRSSPITLDEEDSVEEAMRDAERRIGFGYQNTHPNYTQQYAFIYMHLAYAFSSTEERKGLFRGDVSRAILYSIAEEYE